MSVPVVGDLPDVPPLPKRGDRISSSKECLGQVLQHGYTALFTFELLLRICGNGWGFFCSEDWAWGFLAPWLLSRLLVPDLT